MATALVASDYRVWWIASDCTTVIAGITDAGVLETLAGFNIDIDFTTGNAITVDINAPLASDTYVYGLDVDIQQTAGYTDTYATAGGLIGVRGDVHVDYVITDVYGVYGNVYIDPAATCTVNDAYGLYGTVTLVGPFTAGAATSEIAAIKGEIVAASTGSYDGRVYGLMLQYDSTVNYSGVTALIFGTTAAGAYCDYGMYVLNASPNMTAGILIDDSGAGSIVTGIAISATCTTAALQIGVSGTPAGDFVWYGTTASYAVTFDANGDTNGSVLIGADTYGLMFNLYGDVTGCGVFWDPSGDTNGTLSVGATGGSKGVDMVLYGDTSGAYVTWDRSADDLIFSGAASLVAVTGSFSGTLTLTGDIDSSGLCDFQFEPPTGSGTNGHILKSTLTTATSYSGTTAGLVVKNYFADNACTVVGGEFTGLYVNVKQTAVLTGGAKSSLISAHNYGTGGDYQSIDYGIILYGDLTAGYELSGGTSTYGIKMDNQTISSADILLSSGALIQTGAADPNGSVTGVDGSIYLRTGTSTANTVLYICTGGTTWTANTT